MSRYAKTQDQLAGMVGLSRQQVSNYLKRNDCPSPTKAGWNVEKIQRYIKDTQLSGLKGDGSLRDEKVLREIKLLDVKIEKEVGNLADVRDVQAEYVKKLTKFRFIIDGFRDHQCAKHPELSAEIATMCDELLELMAADKK